jgi:hypothetical protein
VISRSRCRRRAIPITPAARPFPAILWPDRPGALLRPRTACPTATDSECDLAAPPRPRRSSARRRGPARDAAVGRGGARGRRCRSTARRLRDRHQ